MREQYGFQVSVSAVREASEKHGRSMQLEMEVEVRMPVQGVRRLITEIDGAFVLIVEVGEGEGDKRKTRKYK